MIIVFLILVIVASVAIALFILIQNPKGGGLSGTFAGFNSQFMGVKQTTDVLENGTWIFAAIVGLLCVLSPIFIPNSTVGSAMNYDLINKAPDSAPHTASQGTLPGAYK
jgi:preprotein translocase subunit SecG